MSPRSRPSEGPTTAHNRKPELSVQEIERQYDAWGRLRVAGTVVVEIDNEGPQDQSMAELLQVMKAAPA